MGRFDSRMPSCQNHIRELLMHISLMMPSLRFVSVVSHDDLIMTWCTLINIEFDNIAH